MLHIQSQLRSSLSAVSCAARSRVHLYVLGHGWCPFQSYPPPANALIWHLNAGFGIGETPEELDHSRAAPARGSLLNI